MLWRFSREDIDAADTMMDGTRGKTICFYEPVANHLLDGRVCGGDSGKHEQHTPEMEC